jgi:hypothetical protein
MSGIQEGGLRMSLLSLLGARKTSRVDCGREKKEKTRRGRALEGKNMEVREEVQMNYLGFQSSIRNQARGWGHYLP